MNNEFYNGKIKCVSSNNEVIFSKGNIYTVENGTFKDERNRIWHKGVVKFNESLIPNDRFKSLAEIHNRINVGSHYRATFKEVPSNPIISHNKSFKKEIAATFNRSSNSQNYSLHITTDGKTTTCIIKDGKKEIKRTQAVCARVEAFDFETGARIAFDRCCTNLAENSSFKFKEVKRHAKVGEYVKIVKAELTNDCYKNNDIFEIIEVDGGDVYFKTAKTHPCCEWRNRNGCSYVRHEEYVVLERYVPPIVVTKEEFKPHLVMADTGEFICEIGQICETTLQFGEKLYSGDVVEYYSMLDKQIIKNSIAVCKNSEMPERITPLYFSNGIGRDNARGIQLRKVRSYKDLKDGEVIGSMKAILSEVTNNENK